MNSRRTLRLPWPWTRDAAGYFGRRAIIVAASQLRSRTRPPAELPAGREALGESPAVIPAGQTLLAGSDLLAGQASFPVQSGGPDSRGGFFGAAGGRRLGIAWLRGLFEAVYGTCGRLGRMFARVIPGRRPHPGDARASCLGGRIDEADSERGDVPGWVLVTLMTAGLVIAIWTVAGPALISLFNAAIERIRNF